MMQTTEIRKLIDWTETASVMLQEVRDAARAGVDWSQESGFPELDRARADLDEDGDPLFRQIILVAALDARETAQDILDALETEREFQDGIADLPTTEER